MATCGTPGFYVPRPDGGLFGTKWAYGQSEKAEYTLEGMPRCPLCQGALTTMIWRQPHRISISRSDPARWPDILFGPDMYDLMISGRMKALYETFGLTGVPEFAPAAEIVRAGRKRAMDLSVAPVYHNVFLGRPTAEIDLEASGFEFAEPRMEVPHECPACGSARRLLRRTGFRIRPGSWQGEDVFKAPWGPRAFVSERFVRVCEDNEIRGVVFVPAETDAADFTGSKPW